MQEFIFRLDKKDEVLLGPFRCYTTLKVANDGNHTWLRGLDSLLHEDKKLKQLPVRNTFIINEQNLLFPPGGLTPVEKIGELDWQPLSEYIKVELPVSAMPGQVIKKIPIKLVPSELVQKGAALLTSLATWKDYAEKAAGIRLKAVLFAVSGENEVLIIGHPLPALPGSEYWMENNILIPSGYAFEIPMVSAFFEQLSGKDKNSFILFQKDGSWERIDKNFFVRGKRSAVRMTPFIND